MKRINIGGKLLTNYLKELVSYRQWNMMDEFVLINQVKEQLCYVSMDVMKDLTAANKYNRVSRSTMMLDYQQAKLRKFFVLPDFHNIIQGYVKQDDEAVNQQQEQVRHK